MVISRQGHTARLAASRSCTISERINLHTFAHGGSRYKSEMSSTGGEGQQGVKSAFALCRASSLVSWALSAVLERLFFAFFFRRPFGSWQTWVGNETGTSFVVGGDAGGVRGSWAG